MAINKDIPDEKNKGIYELIERILSNYFNKNRPYFLGIAGAGGAGKTTFARNLISFLGEENASTIDLDDYLLSREERGKLEVTGYNPRANKLSLARSNLEELKAGKAITKPKYNHSTGLFLPDEKVEPKQITVVEGVTTLYPELKELYDLSFFLDATDETQIKSRITRDVKERGYTREQALALFEAIKPDYGRYIEPTKEFADIVFKVDVNYVMTPTHINEKFR